MKKYKFILLLLVTIFVSVLSLDYFFYDISEVFSNLLKPLPLEMDKDHKVSVLFENKIFVDGTEIQAMPLGTIIGDKDYNYGLMQIGGKNVVIAIKAYKTSDCKSDEIYADFKLGEGTSNRKFVFHASASAKIQNRVAQVIAMQSKEMSAELTINTIAYFGPPKQVSRYNPTLFPAAEASQEREPSVYQITYHLLDKNLEKLKSGSVVTKEDTVAKIGMTTQVSKDVLESLNHTMKISKGDEDYLQLELYSVYQMGEEDERMVVTENVKLNENNYFFDGRLRVEITEFKKN